MPGKVHARVVLLAAAVAASACSKNYGEGAVYARLADLAPVPATDLIDFCAAQAGSGVFEGPILRYSPPTADPSGTGISYGMVSKYFAATAGIYVFRIVDFSAG